MESRNEDMEKQPKEEIEQWGWNQGKDKFLKEGRLPKQHVETLKLCYLQSLTLKRAIYSSQIKNFLIWMFLKCDDTLPCFLIQCGFWKTKIMIKINVKYWWEDK